MSSIDIDYFPTSTTAKRMLSRVSPIYSNAYVAKWLYQVMGIEIDEAWKIVKELRDQAFTSTVTWGITYQEYKYSINPDNTLTLDERRARLHRKKTTKYPMNPGRIEKYMEDDWGMKCEIDETYAAGVFLIAILQDDDNNLRSMLKDLKEIKPSHLSWKLLYRIINELIEYESVNMSDGFDVYAAMRFADYYPWRDRRFDGGWNFTKPECYDGSWILDGDRYFNGTLPGDEDQIERGRVFDGEWQLIGEYNFMPHEYSRKILFYSAEEERLSASAEMNQRDVYGETLNFDSRERIYDGSWMFGPTNHIQDNNFDESIELDQHDNETLDEDSGLKISAKTAENYPYVRMQFFNGSWMFNRPQCFDGEYRFDGETMFDGAPYSTDPTATTREFNGSWTFDGTEALNSSMIHVRFDADESAGDREVMNIASGYADTESLAEDENESVQLDYSFHPHEFTGHCHDDNYTKKTCIWSGNGFVMPESCRNESLGNPDNRIHTCPPSEERANIRSATPRGFAKAVFLANAPHLKANIKAA